MKKLLPLIILCFVCVAAGQSKASLNSWKGLTLNESTPEDAKKILGDPKKDKEGQSFRPLVYSKWFGNRPDKTLREIEFKNIEGFDGAVLYFKDGKLVVIELDMKKDLTASALVDAYESKFYPLVGNYGAGISPSDLAEGKREIIYPARFPVGYFMASANKEVIGMALARVGDMEGLAAIMTSPSGRAGAISSSLPGLVRNLQLVSRKLENTKGVDLLR